mgnify:CR=1 FL=1|jgi:hypothetical protein
MKIIWTNPFAEDYHVFEDSIEIKLLANSVTKVLLNTEKIASLWLLRGARHEQCITYVPCQRVKKVSAIPILDLRDPSKHYVNISFPSFV